MTIYSKMSPSQRSRNKSRLRKKWGWMISTAITLIGLSLWISHRFLNDAGGIGNKIQKRLKDNPLKLPIRAAFYEPTDSLSYLSLKTNIGKVNLLVTESIFIKPGPDTAFVQENFQGASLIRSSGVKTLAMLSNYYGDDFNGTLLHRIFHQPAKRARLINDVVKIVQANHFAGVNIDFEEMIEDSNEPLVLFVKELYAKMHPLGLLVSIDISPFNADFNIKELIKINDYLFLMAYDEYNDTTKPGPVSSRTYVQASVDEMTRQLSTKQIAGQLILCVAGYGYDWPLHGKAKTISCEQALMMVKDNECKIDTANKRQNLDCTYRDVKGITHTIYFTNAATNLNSMKFAAGRGMAGVALWRLGLEDHKVWSVYDKELNNAVNLPFEL